MQTGTILQIRKGKQEDLPEVLALIKELATYEKAPDEVVVTLNEMQNWGFGKEKVFDFILNNPSNCLLFISLKPLPTIKNSLLSGLLLCGLYKLILSNVT